MSTTQGTDEKAGSRSYCNNNKTTLETGVKQLGLPIFFPCFDYKMSSLAGRGADTSVGEAAPRDTFQLNLPRDRRFGFL